MVSSQAQVDQLYQLGSNSYFGESAFTMTNFGDRYWGNNSQKLNAIKTKYDENSVFSCYNCVGGSSQAFVKMIFTSTFISITLAVMLLWFYIFMNNILMERGLVLVFPKITHPSHTRHTPKVRQKGVELEQIWPKAFRHTYLRVRIWVSACYLRLCIRTGCVRDMLDKLFDIFGIFVHKV